MSTLSRLLESGRWPAAAGRSDGGRARALSVAAGRSRDVRRAIALSARRPQHRLRAGHVGLESRWASRWRATTPSVGFGPRRRGGRSTTSAIISRWPAHGRSFVVPDSLPHFWPIMKKHAGVCAAVVSILCEASDAGIRQRRARPLAAEFRGAQFPYSAVVGRDNHRQRAA
jgi:hypothetical protein